MFTDGDLGCDDFLGGRIRLWQPRQGYRAGIDPVLLAAAVPARRGESVLELGCGAGTALLCLAARVPGLELTGIELQPAYAALARRNAGENGIDLDVIEADLADPPAGLRRRSFAHVIANPPYFQRHRGTVAADPGRDLAAHETTPLAAWLSAAGRRLAPKGRLTLIQRAERLPELMQALGPALGSVDLLPLAPRPGRAAKLVLLRAVKGGRGAFRLLPPQPLHRGARHASDGDDHAPEIGAVLRDAAPLPWPAR